MYDYQTEDTPPPKFDGTLGIISAFVFPQLERRKASSEGGKRGMQERWKGNTTNKVVNKPLNKGLNNIPITQDKDKDKDKDKDIDIDTPPTPSEGDTRTNAGEKRFKPPTVDEVRAYCAERKNGVDPQRFVDYYTSNGWKVGKSPMKNWKAAVRNWEKNSRDKPLEQTHTSEEREEFYELAIRRGLGG